MHRFLSRLADEPVCFFKVPGNAGDALVQAGTSAAFDRASLCWDVVQPGDDVNGRTVMIGGGGNLTPPYDHVSSALHRFLDCDPRRVIILPHTIRGHTDLLGRLRSHDTVFCRERVSLAHVRRSGRAVARLAHDMAFHLDPEDLLDDQQLSAAGADWLNGRLAAKGWSLRGFMQRPTMTFTRMDDERGEASPVTDMDISHELIHGSIHDVSSIAAWGLLECIRSSQQIVTDRLHVGIGAGLLNVPTTLLPNSYDKNRKVFDYSIHKLGSVRFES